MSLLFLIRPLPPSISLRIGTRYISISNTEFNSHKSRYSQSQENCFGSAITMLGHSIDNEEVTATITNCTFLYSNPSNDLQIMGYGAIVITPLTYEKKIISHFNPALPEASMYTPVQLKVKFHIELYSMSILYFMNF